MCDCKPTLYWPIDPLGMGASFSSQDPLLGMAAANWNAQLTANALSGVSNAFGVAQDPSFYSKERKARDYAADVRKRKGMQVKRVG